MRHVRTFLHYFGTAIVAVSIAAAVIDVVYYVLYGLPAHLIAAGYVELAVILIILYGCAGVALLMTLLGISTDRYNRDIDAKGQVTATKPRPSGPPPPPRKEPYTPPPTPDGLFVEAGKLEKRQEKGRIVVVRKGPRYE
jgi:hypothetical protein